MEMLKKKTIYINDITDESVIKCLSHYGTTMDKKIFINNIQLCDEYAQIYEYMKDNRIRKITCSMGQSFTLSDNGRLMYKIPKDLTKNEYFYYLHYE